jgi:outer membrane protein OmpA-like peptidoglycan-associated protein
MAGVALVGEEMLVITKKEAGGQYLYKARRGKPQEAERDVALNTGQINSVVGGNLAAGQVFVYHKSGRRDGKISVYQWQNGEFVKGEELPVPRLRNHSYNLGMFLTEDQQRLFITAELSGTQGYDDLYLSEWNGKAWSKPRNLGKQVNSRGAEFAPFVTNDSLFFSRQQGETAYIYGAALQDGRPGEAVRLESVVNEKEAYNAYFRKNSNNTVWVSASKDGQSRYTAYLLGGTPVPVVEEPKHEEEEPAVQEEAVATVAALPVRAATPALVLYNEFNRVHLSLEELAGLSRFLRQQPKGASLVVKGYSDGYGEPAAKQRVSAQRAQSVKHYIQRYFAAKGFKVEVESEVLPAKGKAHRKTELYLVQ